MDKEDPEFLFKWYDQENREKYYSEYVNIGKEFIIFSWMRLKNDLKINLNESEDIKQYLGDNKELEYTLGILYCITKKDYKLYNNGIKWGHYANLDLFFYETIYRDKIFLRLAIDAVIKQTLSKLYHNENTKLINYSTLKQLEGYQIFLEGLSILIGVCISIALALTFAFKENWIYSAIAIFFSFIFITLNLFFNQKTTKSEVIEIWEDMADNTFNGGNSGANLGTGYSLEIRLKEINKKASVPYSLYDLCILLQKSQEYKQA